MKKIIVILFIMLPILSLANESSTNTGLFKNMDLISSIIGGLIGGILGVIGTLWTSYYGSKKLIEFMDKKDEKKINGPRKKLLLSLLEDVKNYPAGRTLSTLTMVSGTTPEECRRLLIEVGARGVKHEGGIEGWALIKYKPITEK